MSLNCPEVYFNDLVTWNGVRGITDREWTAYDPKGVRHGWRLILLETGERLWMAPELLLARRIRAEFIGMPNEDNRPLPGRPLTLWQEIPHLYDEYLTHHMNAGCMYCGLGEANEIHTGVVQWNGEL